MTSEAKISLAITGLLVGLCVFLVGTHYYNISLAEKKIDRCLSIIQWESDRVEGLLPSDRRGYPAVTEQEKTECLYGSYQND